MDETIETMNEEVLEEPIDPPDNIEEAVDLRSELESLRQRLETAERTAREISAGWREFSELYPDADLNSLPDSFNSDVERGIPPAAAYALEMRRREIRRLKIEESDRRAREMSSGRVSGTDDGLYSPDEVRAMPPAEVRKNMEKIRRSMKSWR
jgi:hypothetical protein